ncbi:MAG: EAL domain-containing protein [Lachnospiraceae bacterium]|nr:EAL domain-containing protein [Lachnospiraceae bacterium]
MHSIRFKITTITVSAILISILLVFLATYLTIHDENDISSVQRMNLIADDAKKTLEIYFEGIEQSVEMAVNIAVDSLDSTVLVENGILTSPDNHMSRTAQQQELINAHIAAHTKKVEDALSSVATRAHGVVSFYYYIIPEISDNKYGFFYSKVGKSGYEKRDPLSVEDLDPEDEEHSMWYFTSVRRGRPSWVGPYSDYYNDDIWVCSYLIPVYKVGTMIGIIGMDIPVETLATPISEIHFYKTGFACMLDEKNRVIYHPTLEPGLIPSINPTLLTEEIFGHKTNNEELIRYDFNGEQRQMSFTTLSTGMKLIAIAPVDEITATWSALERNVILIAGIITALFALILFVLMGVITLPLKKLTDASKMLADGDYGADLSYRYDSKDEIGTLTKAFVTMRDQQKEYIADLNHRAITDSLTNLPNMRHFFVLAEAERQRILASGRHPVLLFFNMVGMKFFNRQYSFEEGDRLILEISRILSRHYGDNNVSRFSQDHFAIITTEEGLEEELEHIFEECEMANDGKSLPVRVGIYPNRLGDVNISAAYDRAKYACDQLRGTYVSDYRFFDIAMLNQVENSRYIISHIDQAIEEHWIQVYFQPIIRAANGLICDEEALARWIDPVKGFLSPGEFIPVLEQAKLIYKLDLYILDLILEKMKARREKGYVIVPQSLNLSRADFDSVDIVQEICRRIDAAGFSRDLLTIEVTESIVGSDFSFMKNQIERLQELGFHVWMDDFGSGYSSLDVLQDIHFNLIKFDMRFMHRFNDGDESKIILTQLMKMASSLGVDTVTEGVETKEQVEFLREIGCTRLQGYYYSRPIPTEDIEKGIREKTLPDFENPDEAGYYNTVGRISLYDLPSVTNDNSDDLSGFFDTLPMAVVESDSSYVKIVRCNKSYREFMVQAFGKLELDTDLRESTTPEGIASPLFDAVNTCRNEGSKVFIDEEIPNGSVHSMIRHIAINPVTGVYACLIVVLEFVAR